MKEQDEYKKQYAAVSPKLEVAVADKVGELLGTYLLMYQEPKGYRNWRHMVSTIADSLLLWALTEDLLALAPEYTSDDEEYVKRLAKLNSAEAGGELPMTQARESNQGYV